MAGGAHPTLPFSSSIGVAAGPTGEVVPCTGRAAGAGAVGLVVSAGRAAGTATAGPETASTTVAGVSAGADGATGAGLAAAVGAGAGLAAGAAVGDGVAVLTGAGGVADGAGVPAGGAMSAGAGLAAGAGVPAGAGVAAGAAAGAGPAAGEGVAVGAGAGLSAGPVVSAGAGVTAGTGVPAAWTGGGVPVSEACEPTSARALATNAHHRTTTQIANPRKLLDEANLPTRTFAPRRAPDGSGFHSDWLTGAGRTLRAHPPRRESTNGWERAPHPRFRAALRDAPES
jgi:hypothetical protein